MSSTCEFGGTVTETCLASAYGDSELCIIFPASPATVPEVTSWASVSRSTAAPLVRLLVIPLPTSAPVAATYTDAVAV